MCRRWLLTIWMMVVSCAAIAQNDYNVPDYNEIERLTKDKGSVFYYGSLFEKFKANDTTLTLRDYRMLYYGYFFQPDYSPFKFTSEADTMKAILALQELQPGDWKELQRVGRAHLAQNPFDLKGLNVVWIASKQTGDSAAARLYFDKLKKLVQTILSTGDGMSEKTAFHVVHVAHEYDIVNILGFEFGGKQNLTDNKCDFLTLKTNDEKVEGLYFDVSQIFKGYERSVTIKGD
ncbi:MAG: DUF4919 domain-containing protein [Sphingobacteriales bacterium]|nr:MAG: DUF4919 domain-containing protein [Sphingobacteriales bacterium]